MQMVAFRHIETKRFFRGYDRKGGQQTGKNVGLLFPDDTGIISALVVRHNLYEDWEIVRVEINEVSSICLDPKGGLMFVKLFRSLCDVYAKTAASGGGAFVDSDNYGPGPEVYRLWRIKNAAGQYFQGGDPTWNLNWTGGFASGKRHMGKVYTTRRFAEAAIKTWPKKFDTTGIKIVELICCEYQFHDIKKEK